MSRPRARQACAECSEGSSEPMTSAFSMWKFQRQDAGRHPNDTVFWTWHMRAICSPTRSPTTAWRDPILPSAYDTRGLCPTPAQCNRVTCCSKDDCCFIRQLLNPLQQAQTDTGLWSWLGEIYVEGQLAQFRRNPRRLQTDCDCGDLMLKLVASIALLRGQRA